VVRLLHQKLVRTTKVDKTQSNRNNPKRSLDYILTDNFNSILSGVVYDLVRNQDFVAAIVATFERGDALPVRALYVDPNLASVEQIYKWQEFVAQFSNSPISIVDPHLARVYIYKSEYQDNLSVQAAMARTPITSDDLFDLFTPIAPLASKSIIKGIQVALKIKQIVAFPLLLEFGSSEIYPSQHVSEYVGNLIVAKSSNFSEQDFRTLSSYSRQIGSAILGEERRMQTNALQELMFAAGANMSESDVLYNLTQRVIGDFGYVVVIIFLLEKNDCLVLRAINFDPTYTTENKIIEWEKRISEFTGESFNFTDPEKNRVYLNQEKYSYNLNVRTAMADQPIATDELFDVFKSIIPDAVRELVHGIQQILNVERVIAIPFQDGQEYMGNIIVASQSHEFNNRDLDTLQSLSRQQAFILRNIKLYRESEERKSNARVFGNMVFNSVTSLHTLNNLLGKARVTIQLINSLPENERHNFLESSPSALDYLDAASDLLNNLSVEPSKADIASVTNVNSCLRTASNKVLQYRDDWVHLDLSQNLPSILISTNMITEVFSIIINNAVDAIKERGVEPQLWMKSEWTGGTSIVVHIHDNGIGIKPENIAKIFEFRWTTKGTMGLGLFWAKDYIESIGGQITVNSHWQEGTEFSVVLPVHSAVNQKGNNF